MLRLAMPGAMSATVIAKGGFGYREVPHTLAWFLILVGLIAALLALLWWGKRRGGDDDN
jgi:predicted permease